MPSSPQSSHVVTSKFTPKSHIQSFSYHLADGNWHQVALTITSDHVAHLYVDCQLISRESLNDVSWDFLNLTQLQVWVGQRNVKRANFKVSKIISGSITSRIVFQLSIPSVQGPTLDVRICRLWTSGSVPAIYVKNSILKKKQI